MATVALRQRGSTGVGGTVRLPLLAGAAATASGEWLRTQVAAAYGQLHPSPAPSSIRIVHGGRMVGLEDTIQLDGSTQLVAVLPPGFGSLCSPPDDGPSEYELQREANIRRNEEALRQLGVRPARELLSEQPARKRQRRQPAAKDGAAEPTRRSTRRGTPVPRLKQPAPASAAPAATAAAVAAPAATAPAVAPALDDEEPVGVSTFRIVPSAVRRDFAWRVLQIVQAIPRGKVAAYGQCAALAGSPKNARQVGKLLATGLASGGAPWQRVINSAGAISLPAAAGGDRQRRLLSEEGVEFKPSGKATPES